MKEENKLLCNILYKKSYCVSYKKCTTSENSSARKTEKKIGSCFYQIVLFGQEKINFY